MRWPRPSQPPARPPASHPVTHPPCLLPAVSWIQSVAPSAAGAWHRRHGQKPRASQTTPLPPATPPRRQPQAHRRKPPRRRRFPAPAAAEDLQWPSQRRQPLPPLVCPGPRPCTRSAGRWKTVGAAAVGSGWQRLETRLGVALVAVGGIRAGAADDYETQTWTGARDARGARDAMGAVRRGACSKGVTAVWLTTELRQYSPWQSCLGATMPAAPAAAAAP